MFEDVHVGDDGEEGEERKNYEEFHYKSLAFFALFSASGTEDEGLVGVSESLGNHGHYHCYFGACTIDAELGVAFFARDDEAEAYFVGHLVEDAGEAEEQQGPSVAQHTVDEFEVDTETQIAQFG